MSLATRIQPPLVQETQELIGMLSDTVSDLAIRAARGDGRALEMLHLVRDEVHSLIADAKLSAEGE